MRFVPVGLLVVLLAVPTHSISADPPAPEEKPPTVEELVANLASPVFAVREKAQRDLWKRGEEAVPALEKAAKGDDPEAARRARELLDKFAWGILPDTPPAVLKLIRQFQAGDSNPDRADAVRKEAIGELLKKGRPGVSAVRAILKKDIPAESREKLTSSVTALVRREVPLLLVAGKLAEADELVSLHGTGTTPDGAADFAAYHVLRGDLPAATAHVEALRKSGRRSDGVKLVLVYLYRAAGQWTKARAAAEDLPVEPEATSFQEILLEEEGNWRALADLSPGRELNHPDAVRLTLLRLAGRQQKFDAEVKQVRADADELVAGDAMDAAVALLTNHRAVEATELLLEKKQNLGLLSEILISRMRYKEALDLIGGGAKEKETISTAERLEFNLRRARVLMTVGLKDQAVQLFEQVAGGLTPRADPRVSRGVVFARSARSLIRTELRVGLRDLACEHAALFVRPDDGITYASQGESPFELLFPYDPIAAEALFFALRAKKIPGDQPGATMIRTRDLLSGTAGAAAVDQAVKVLREAVANTPPAAKLVKAHRYLALAMVCRMAKRAGEAEGAYKVAAELTAADENSADATGARSWVYGAPDPARVWIEWGEYLSDLGRHRDAATVFEAGWKLYPDQPLPLFLCGQALVKAGAAKEGAERIERAHWVSLGNEKVRGRFLDEMVRRGEAQAIRREVPLITKACWSHDHTFGNVMNQCARGSALVRDFATAETCGQRSLLVVMRKPGVYFVDTGAYLNVPHDLLVFRSRALVTAGKFEEARASAREVLAVTPGHLDFVTGIVPDLDRAGRKQDADDIFNRVWDTYEKMLKNYPESAAARGALGQLAGRCGRKLDDGLKYAKAAVSSDGDSQGYREALAEVHFRRGERNEAVKLMQQLCDEHPRSALYKRQLSRYRTAAFDSPWPHVAE